MGLPTLCIGMQYIHLASYPLAKEYLNISHSIFPNDPLLMNELGVLNYANGDYNLAKDYLYKALDLLQNSKSKSNPSESIWCNLGHCHRQLENYSESLDCFSKVLEINGNNSNALVAIGLIHHLNNDLDTAILNYHLVSFIM